jgi:glutathione S-transferase
MEITLYYAPMSSSTRVQWALEELGVPYEKVKLNLLEGDQKKPEFLAVNPNGKVPAMVIDGTNVFESHACLLVLAERFGAEKGLFPADPAGRAEAITWMTWGSVTLSEALVRLLRNTSDRFPADERNPKAADGARADLRSLLGILDATLEGREYLVGGAFSLVDLSIAAFAPLLGRLGVDFGPWKNVNAWLARSMQRPALARTMMG